METEMAEVLNSVTGEVTGEVVDLRIAHKEGIWHGSIHVWVISEDRKKILLQKRCSEKIFFPNIWDISVGGHISAYEDALTTALREMNEELGIDSSKYNLEYVTRVKESFVNNGVISNEFVSVYKIISDIDISSINLQKEEVSDCRWFSKKEFNELINNGEIINHTEEFNIINSILE